LATVSCKAVKNSCGTDQPLFFYDFSAPYCYLSAFRVDETLPVKARWQPIVFGALMGAIGKVSWTLRKGPERDTRMREFEQLTAARGLPLSWPRDWPFGTYSTLVVRAAVIAGDHGKLEEFSLGAYRVGLGSGGDLSDVEVVLGVATEVGLDPDLVRAGVNRVEVKRRVRDITANAVRIGVTGVPSIVAGQRIFWGDDELENAAQAIGPAAGPPRASA
jgi:2-hydroxychromene-2-carboxylate isomerase